MLQSSYANMSHYHLKQTANRTAGVFGTQPILDQSQEGTWAVPGWFLTLPDWLGII